VKADTAGKEKIQQERKRYRKANDTIVM